METAPVATPTPTWTLTLPRGRALHLEAGRPRVMGILNLTPDSFSDGGRWSDPDQAAARGLEMLAQGADLIDLGAESTRPGGGVYGAGAATVPAEEELARLLPVLTRLRARTDAPLSVDTRKGEVATRALEAGADLVNDVGALADPDLGRAVAAAGCPLVLMHSRGDLAAMQSGIHFTDLLAEVRAELAQAIARAAAAGIPADRLILDPGIGFGKTVAQNLTLIGRLDAFADLGRPVLVGASRKSFLGRLAAAGGGSTDSTGLTGLTPLPPAERLPGSLAAVVKAAEAGAALVRVHDVAETVQLLAVWQALAEAAASSSGAPALAGGVPA